MIDTKISVSINGVKHTGWKKLYVNRSMTSLVGEFYFEITDYKNSDVTLIDKFQECIISIDLPNGKSFTLMTGIIYSFTKSISGNEKYLSFAGRGKTSLLTDCANTYKTGTWKKSRIIDICQDLCDAYSIHVTGELGPTIENFTRQIGETAYDSILRLCKSHSLLPLTTGKGELLLTYSGNDKSDFNISEGANAKNIEIESDGSEQYSDYVFVGQSRNNNWTKKEINIKGSAKDNDVTVYRPIVFVAERHMKADDITKRASWEAQVRSGRSQKVNVSVRGWLQDPYSVRSRPWVINEITQVLSTSLNIDSDLIISSVTYSIDSSSGIMTHMELLPPETFSPEPGEVIQLSKRSKVVTGR